MFETETRLCTNIVDSETRLRSWKYNLKTKINLKYTMMLMHEQPVNIVYMYYCLTYNTDISYILMLLVINWLVN